MGKIIDKIAGDLSEKKRYRDNEKRAKALSAEYAEAYMDIKHYLWNTSGILTIEPLVSLVDILEEAAANGKHVVDITGPDVAAFADDLVRGEVSYKDRQRSKLNDKFNT
jgi:DNA-binding ferritin-like protein (Dps family)